MSQVFWTRLSGIRPTYRIRSVSRYVGEFASANIRLMTGKGGGNEVCSFKLLPACSQSGNTKANARKLTMIHSRSVLKGKVDVIGVR